MKPALKKLCLFGLSEGIGKMLINQTDDEKVKWRATKLKEAGNYAIKNCRIKIDKTKLKQTERKIESIYEDQSEFDIITMLSFILCGVNDLFFFSKDKNNKSLLLLEKRLVWFIKYYDPKLENEDIHQKAFKKYYKWVEN